MLEIKDLHVETGGVPILKGLDLTVKAGTVHAVMGPNGSGKSTLSKVVAGDPEYAVTRGTVTLEINGRPKNLLDMSPDERARAGVFLGFQYPVEIPGVSNTVFLRTAFNAICKAQGIPEMDEAKFDALLAEKMARIGMKSDFAGRAVNVDFSGGEKKRNEILQMAVLGPRLAFLDETDSGLDVDSLRSIGDSITRLKHPGMALVLITHYQRLLDYVKPDVIHVLVQGRIVKSGGPELALEIEKNGYDRILQAAGV